MPASTQIADPIISRMVPAVNRPPVFGKGAVLEERKKRGWEATYSAEPAPGDTPGASTRELAPARSVTALDCDAAQRA
jgi:hypothetical protein